MRFSDSKDPSARQFSFNQAHRLHKYSIQRAFILCVFPISQSPYPRKMQK